MLTSVSLLIFVNQQFKRNLDEVGFKLSGALTNAISQSILDYVVEGNSRKTREVLKRITKENPEIEYLVVVDFDNKLFSSSSNFTLLPEKLKNSDHLNCNNNFAIKNNTLSSERLMGSRIFKHNNKTIHDYSHPFIKNLSAHIHFGLKNSLYTEPVEKINTYSIFVVIVISIIGFVIAYILGKRISRPIELLSNTVTHFGKTGEYNSGNIRTTDKDIIKLITSFQTMIDDRLGFESEISQYKDNLENLVDERTKLLEDEISKHKQTEKKLLNEKEISDKANRAKSEFLSHMSHELRTPLNAVLGFAQLLGWEENKEVKDYSNEILKAGHHLLSLINDILDLSKIEAGKFELSIEEVSWNSVINECYILSKHLLDEKNISFNVNCDESINFIVMADRVRLKQASLNLISNAIKYNESSGSVIISFELNNNMLRMSVKDTGKGIKNENQKRLFMPFERLDMEQAAIDGIGIGLVITKALVESMHGNIGFKSEYGIGSVFWLEFPLVRTEAVEITSSSNSELRDINNIELKSLPIEGVKSILYLEDNPSNMKVVENIFNKYSNIEFYPAYNPSEALTVLGKNIPDLILLDINLPEMDGYEFKKILEQTPEFKNIKVVGVSANAMSHDIEKAKNSGFIDYLPKPINVSELIAVVEKVLMETTV